MKPDRAMTGRAFAAIDRAAGWLAGLGNLAVVVLVATTVVAVIFRYVLNDPIFGVDDISRMLLLVSVACSLAYGGRQDAHVSVDILSVVGGRRVTRWTDLIVRLLGVLIVALTVYALLVQGSCGIRCGHFTPNLAIPFWPFYLLMAAGIGLYGLVLVAELVADLARFDDPEEPGGDKYAGRR